MFWMHVAWIDSYLEPIIYTLAAIEPTLSRVFPLVGARHVWTER